MKKKIVGVDNGDIDWRLGVNYVDTTYIDSYYKKKQRRKTSKSLIVNKQDNGYKR